MEREKFFKKLNILSLCFGIFSIVGLHIGLRIRLFDYLLDLLELLMWFKILPGSISILLGVIVKLAKKYLQLKISDKFANIGILLGIDSLMVYFSGFVK